MSSEKSPCFPCSYEREYEDDPTCEKCEIRLEYVGKWCEDLILDSVPTAEIPTDEVFECLDCGRKISPHTRYGLCHNCRVRKWRKSGARRPTKKITPDMEKSMEKMMVDGLSALKISKAMGLSHSAVKKRRTRWGKRNGS